MVRVPDITASVSGSTIAIEVSRQEKKNSSEEGIKEQFLEFAKKYKEAETSKNQNLLETNDASGHDRPPFLALQHVGISAPRDRFCPTNRHTADWRSTDELQCRVLGSNA
jgi:hypothetical protein